MLNKRCILIYLLFIAGLIDCHAQPFITFCKGWEADVMLEERLRHDFLLYGTNAAIDKDNINRFHLQFSRLDTFGNVLSDWFFRIDTLGKDTFYEGAESSPTHPICYFNNYVITGALLLKTSDNYKTVLLELDSSLKKPIKVKDVTNWGGYTWIMEMLPVSANKLIVSGLTENGDKTNYYCWISELDSNLNIKWTRYYGNNVSFAAPNKILPLDDGYLLAVEYATEYSQGLAGYYKDYVMKLDTLGSQQWNINFSTKTLSANNIEISPTNGGSFIACWNKLLWRGTLFRDFTAQYVDSSALMLAKFDRSGNILQQKNLFDFMHATYGLDTFCEFENTDMTMANDSSVVVTGDFWIDHQYCYIIDIDKDLNVKWFHAYDMDPANVDSMLFQHFHSVRTTSNGDFIIGGEYASAPSSIFPQGTQSAVAIMLDKNGCLKDNCGLVGIREVDMMLNRVDKIIVYPNPARDRIYLNAENSVIHNEPYTIINGLGQIVAYGKYSNGIDISVLHSGLYHLRLQTKEAQTPTYASFIKE